MGLFTATQDGARQIHHIGSMNKSSVDSRRLTLRHRQRRPLPPEQE
eukprot:CAMPEP_0118932782 /NCGR_PEP_ID=MMETSP1169-20130426/10620_1 /TAXON_ID=36882 /ORGANISM="Pyramimonas obovata, Strain CCMP722" /LENGTH=45 /DNA_ID= /DNA_START= /DNA_END= /DNA_ORIENTATION=